MAKRSTVSNRDARREAISQWFMEFSVLWAVFPLLDWLVEKQAIELLVLAASLGISLTAGLVGFILTGGERT